MSITDLKDKHKDSICYIIGGGESLQYLTNDYFESNGIIIALNKTIQKIQELSPSIPVYSQQKDGNLNGRRACNYPDCNNCEFMKNPSPYTLLVHEHESRMCFENYKDRIVFDNIELGLHIHDFSALTAI